MPKAFNSRRIFFNMAAQKKYTVFLTRDVSKKNNTPFWVSGEINIRTVMDELGASKVCMEIPGKLEDNEQTVQLNFKPAWSEKMQKLEMKQNDKFKNIGLPMWYREGTKKNGEKIVGNNGPNYNILDLQDMLGNSIQARIFLNKSPTRTEKSPAMNISFSGASKKNNTQTKTATTVPSDDNPF